MTTVEIDEKLAALSERSGSFWDLPPTDRDTYEVLQQIKLERLGMPIAPEARMETPPDVAAERAAQLARQRMEYNQ